MSFHGVIRSAIERLDQKILFDPFTEQLDLPTAHENKSNRQGWQDKVVRQKDKVTVFFDKEETDSSVLVFRWHWPTYFGKLCAGFLRDKTWVARPKKAYLSFLNTVEDSSMAA